MNKSLHEQYGRDSLAVLSGIMQEQINELGLPPRFRLEAASKPNANVIVDTVTGRKVELGLCDMHGAIKALAAFY